MDFSLTEERQMLTDTIGRFLQKEYSLKDRNEAAFSHMGFNPDMWKKLTDLGILGALFCEENGGFGGTGFDLTAIFEALGHGLVVEPLVDNVLIPGQILVQVGNTAQKDLIEGMIAGRCRIALAHYENASHYETAFVTTSAAKTGDGRVLNGSKSVVKFAQGADYIIVSVRTAGSEVDPAGISLFLVPATAKGLTLNDVGTVDGGRVAEVLLENVCLPDDAMIGMENSGFGNLENAIGYGLLALSAEALGIMERIKELTLEYLRTRKQFGLAIGQFQALQHRMAQVLLEVEQARSAVINAANDLDSDYKSREQALSAAKYSIGRIGALVVEESIQMHGGIGMTWEYDLGHFAKRLTMIDHEYGDEDFHLARYIALGNTP